MQTLTFINYNYKEIAVFLLGLWFAHVGPVVGPHWPVFLVKSESESESALLAKYVNTYKEFDSVFFLRSKYTDVNMNINLDIT